MKKNLLVLMFVFASFSGGLFANEVKASTFKVEDSNRYVSNTKDIKRSKINNQKLAYKKLISRIANVCSANYVFGRCAEAIERATVLFDAMVEACQVAGPACDEAQVTCDNYALYVMLLCSYPETAVVKRETEIPLSIDSKSSVRIRQLAS